MTKKHFIALADVLRRTEPPRNDSSWFYWEQTRNLLADFCQSQNSQFNRERWLAYIAGTCGPNGGTVRA